jgi:uncharacterized protein YbjT (DUF2867 family)
MKILLMGATGLTGQSFLALALAHPEITEVVAPTRRPLPVHPKLMNPVMDFTAWDLQAPWWAAEAYVCCLGTTLRAAGSPEAFRRVDLDWVCRLGDLAKVHHVKNFSVVSSLKASSQSTHLYLRTKGEMEDYLVGLHLNSLTLIQPSFLRGGSRPSFRLGEFLLLAALAPFASLIPQTWRPISVLQVSRALLRTCLQSSPGIHRLPSKDLHALL